MRTVSLLKIYNDYCYEYNLREVTVGLKWEEVSDEEFEKLSSAVATSNTYTRNSFRYVLVEAIQSEEFPGILKSAEDLIRKVKDREDKKRLEAEKRKKKLEATALERKKKQIAKLQKEVAKEESK